MSPVRRIHPKTWDDGVAPLSIFSEEHRQAILDAVAQPRPPARWISLVGGQIESRAWYEWHWARGKKLRRIEADGATGHPGVRRKIPAELRGAVYARDGFACLHCGARTNLSLDHIHPWSLGGPDTFENLQTLCRPCNSRKGARI